MTKLISYFYNNDTLNYFDKSRTLFLLYSIILSIIIIPIFIIIEFIIGGQNVFVLYAALSDEFFLFIFLFILKRYGISIAGNFISLTLTLVLLFWMNMIPEGSMVFKYVQGYYTAYVFVVLSALISSRLIILINSTLILISTTHILIYSRLNNLQDIDILTSGYINHTLVLILITTIVFYLHKFTESAIKKANRETEIKVIKNQELIASEKKVRASNKELIATAVALKESNNELIIANEKAKESDRLKTEFLNNISHEVRTPMNGIMGFSQLLISPNIKGEDREKYFGIISDSSSQLLKIIDDIINISKLETKQVSVNNTEVDINKLLADLLLEYRNKIQNKAILFSLEKVVVSEVIKITSDKTKLHIILSCFIDNAIKYTKKGSIKVGCNVLIKNNSKLLQLYVKDTGIGIAEEKMDIIFTKFTQGESELSREYGGLGIGLSIAKENAILIGAEIDFESMIGAGSRFYINIPI